MSDSSVATAASPGTSSASPEPVGGPPPGRPLALPVSSMDRTKPTRTGQTDTCAEELDRLLASEFQDTRPIERGFWDAQSTRGARGGTANARPSQEEQFYLHRLQISGRPVEFAVTLQATSECEPCTILRLLKQGHVLDPGCQHGRRLYVLVHSNVPLLTRR
jgi:hypothetical protein